MPRVWYIYIRHYDIEFQMLIVAMPSLGYTKIGLNSMNHWKRRYDIEFQILIIVVLRLLCMYIRHYNIKFQILIVAMPRLWYMIS
jgi:hypothetical protein